MSKTETKPNSKTPEPEPETGKETYGKSYSGVIFKDDLKTYDMVQSLLNPMIKKSFFDYLILLSLAIDLALYYYLFSVAEYRQYIVPVFVASYLFWRFAYNLGIGILLYNQSNYNSLTNFCDKHKLFNYDTTGKVKNTRIQDFLELNFKIKYGADYKIKNYPVDFNTWLLYRNFVDLILMQDFVSYIILFFACLCDNKAYMLHNETPMLFYTRWVFGVLFIIINLIVKLDAHNVIKDFAWYWGDFFYIKINNEDLVFDGIFELFPHPMYSIGYIGYYGFALISRSYLVLLISLFAHFTQFLFLYYVEDPHINKIYNNEDSLVNIVNNDTEDVKLKPMMFLSNFNLFRPSDFFVVAVNVLLTVQLWSIESPTTLFVCALTSKVVTSVATSLILHFQSRFKSVTKLHIKYDLNYVDAFNNWCIFFNFQMLLNLNFSFVLFVKEFMHLNSWDSIKNDNFFLLKIILGSLLIITNYVCEKSILNSIGINSWFYGDFWLPYLNHKQLTRNGIYKYLNNPEKFLGVCGIWGLSLICSNSSYLFVLAIVWTLSKIIFISFVETPHMIKLYGEKQVNYDSGFSKTFKKILPSLKMKNLTRSYEKLTNGSSSGTTSPSVASETEVESLDLKSVGNIAELNLSKNPLISSSAKFAEYELELLNVKCEHDKYYLPIGTPIKFRVNLPKNYNKNDWIGLYKVVNTFSSSKATLTSSQNHWIAVNDKSYNARYFGHENEESNRLLFKDKVEDSTEFEQKFLEFNNDLLYWEPGTYELRYHYKDSHDVLMISKEFELRFEKVEISNANFKQNLFNLVKQNNYLSFETYSANKLTTYQINDIGDSYIDLLIEYLNSLAHNLLHDENLRKNLNMNHINSYNIEEFKKKKFNELLKRFSYLIKNSVELGHNSSLEGQSNLNVEFSNEVLIKQANLGNLADKISDVYKILNEIANQKS